MRIPVLIFLIIALTLACGKISQKQNDPVARVYDTYLYREDLAGIIPPGINRNDSLRISQRFIDKWIRNQMFLRLAEVNLPSDEKIVDKQIAVFRASLLIHKYQQYLLGQKMDTIISMNEIHNYYEDHPGNFLLDQSAISGVFLQVPLSAPDHDRILSWFRDESDLIRLEDYTASYAGNYLWFNDEWVYLNDILAKLPPGSYNLPSNVSTLDHISVTDSEYLYFIGITGYLAPRSKMPLSIAMHKIKSIILNQRKIKFLNELEKSIMAEGSSKNSFQYFQ